MTTTRKILSTREGDARLRRRWRACSRIGLLLAFMAAYRNSVDEGAQPVTRARRARARCPRASRGDVIAEKGLFQATGFKRDQVKEGAIDRSREPARAGRGARHRSRAAAHRRRLQPAEEPGPQPSSRTTSGRSRIPLDAAHGMVGQIQTRRSRRRASPASRCSRTAPAAGRGRSCACCCRTSRCCRRLRPPSKAASAARRRPRASCCASATRTRRSWRSRPTTASCGSRCGRPPEPSRTRRRWSRSTGCCSAWTRSRSTASASRPPAQPGRSLMPESITALVALDAGVDEGSVDATVLRGHARRRDRVGPHGSRGELDRARRARRATWWSSRARPESRAGALVHPRGHAPVPRAPDHRARRAIAERLRAARVRVGGGRPRDVRARRRDRSAIAGELRFAVEKAVARRTGGAAAASHRTGVADLRARTEGRHRQDADDAPTSPSRSRCAGQRVVIVDLDLQFGDVGLALGLVPTRTIYDLVKSGGSLDGEKVEAT